MHHTIAIFAVGYAFVSFFVNRFVSSCINHCGSTYQQIPYASEPGRSMNGGLHHVEDPRMLGMGASDLAAAAKGRPIGVGGRPEIPLPPDASSTLYVEGLPANCTRREVSRILLVLLKCVYLSYISSFLPLLWFADIFRPFVGYKEVRLVTKESRHVKISLFCTRMLYLFR